MYYTETQASDSQARKILHWGLPESFDPLNIPEEVGLFTLAMKGKSLREARAEAENRGFIVLTRGLPMVGEDVRLFGICYGDSYYPLMVTLEPVKPPLLH